MKRLEDRKEEILHYYDVGLSIRKLSLKYECSFNTMRKHLVEWVRDRNNEKEKK